VRNFEEIREGQSQDQLNDECSFTIESAVEEDDVHENASKESEDKESPQKTRDEKTNGNGMMNYIFIS
jgi:hypothetical protein